MSKKLLITIIVVVLVVGGIVYWRMANKKTVSQNPAEVETTVVSNPKLFSASSDINTALQKIIVAQKINTITAIDCSKISSDQLIALGDGVMGTLTGDESHHSAMEKVMGGEDGQMTKAEHSKLGEMYLSCLGNAMQNQGTDKMQNSGAEMSGKNMMQGSMNGMHPLAIKQSEKLGEYLVDGEGKTLYAFAKNSAGVSNCSGDCLKQWPAYIVSKQDAQNLSLYYKDVTVITRADGSSQLAYKGAPLYYFVGDSKAGDAMGAGVGGLWQVVKF